MFKRSFILRRLNSSARSASSLNSIGSLYITPIIGVRIENRVMVAAKEKNRFPAVSEMQFERKRQKKPNARTTTSHDALMALSESIQQLFSLDTRRGRSLLSGASGRLLSGRARPVPSPPGAVPPSFPEKSPLPLRPAVQAVFRDA